MKLYLTLIIGLMLTLSACSKGPSDGDMVKSLEQTLAKEFGADFIEVDNFEKINAREMNGLYIATVKYDVEFTKNISAVEKELTNSEIPFASMTVMVLKGMFGSFKKGDTKSVPENEVKFSSSDNGWIIVK